VVTFRYWLRNLFTDEDGEFSQKRWNVFAVILGLVLAGSLAFACRNLPATSRSTVTVTVNDPGNAPVTVIVNQP
jgi:hypothetical protein